MEPQNRFLRIAGIGVAGLVAFIVLLNMFTTVGPGERGVRVTFGSAANEVKDPGLYLTFPFVTNIRKVTVQMQRSDITTGAASKDMQEVTADVAVNWKLDPSKIVETYKNLGNEDEVLTRIITPAVSEVLKASTAQLTAEDILNKRIELKKAVDDGLKTRLSGYGIALYDVSIVHLRFSKEFEKAIEDKQIAEQRAKQAIYEAQQATQTARATIERAKGEAESQRLIKATITSQILQQRAIEKWDGKFPQIMGSGSVPFINMNMKDKE